MAVATNGCDSSSIKEDQSPDFYSNSMTEDLYRIPLLDPVELNSADEAYWFLVPVYNGLSESNDPIDNIDKVGVMDPFVVCFSERTYRDSEMGSAWYVIDVNDKTEKCIITNNDYQYFLQENSIQELELIDVNTAYNESLDGNFLKDR